ncbi:MAG: hypothetical protein PHU44_17990, partial [Syntrophales bacterium]|nr:hypothetical protein [Syntrophales bacterium]
RGEGGGEFGGFRNASFSEAPDDTVQDLLSDSQRFEQLPEKYPPVHSKDCGANNPGDLPSPGCQAQLIEYPAKASESALFGYLKILRGWPEVLFS